MVIKKYVDINPLSDYGNIVKGNRFVGRKEEIGKIRNRVLVENGGNVAIMGLPRVGKSSLAWNALKETSLEKFKVFYINVGSIESSFELFMKIIWEILSELEFLDSFSSKQIEKLQQIKEKIENSKTNIEKKEFIERFFKFSSKVDLNYIVILDEFDHVGKIFKLEDFQYLRELAIKPDIKLTFVTVSRKTIEEIELLNGDALSKLAGVFYYLNLGLFDENDTKEYWDKLNEFGIETDQEYQNLVQYYTGNHPYLLDLFNFEIIEHINDKFNIQEFIEKELRLKLIQWYDHFIALLKEEKLLDKLIQILYGPVYDLDPKSIDRLIKFGVIYKNRDGQFKCFSKFFQEYLYQVQYEIDFWPLWTNTEKLIRSVIKEYLEKNYGENWEEKFIVRFTKTKNSLEKLKEKRDKNLKNFPERASTHLVDYTYPLDMFQVFIAQDWNYFKIIFQKDKKEWKQIFDLLAKIRNPIAHSNEYFVSEEEKNLAISYCKKINELLSNNV